MTKQKKNIICSYCKKKFSKTGIGNHKRWCKKNFNPDIKKQKEIRKKMSGKNHPFYGKKRPEHSKMMMGESSWNRGKKVGPHSKEHNKKISTTLKGRFKGEKNPMFGRTGEKHPSFGKTGKGITFYERKHSEKTKKEMSIGQKISWTEERRKKHSFNQMGEKNPNWVVDRKARFDLYGPNFYDQIFRKARWQLQGGRDLLSGNLFNIEEKQRYHHTDWIKANDNPDNHVWLTSHFHGKVHTKRKRKFYEGILKQNLRALKNGKIPNSWKEENKILYKQEKMTQTKLSN